jgi:outer membrane protein assembly factor BamA
VNIPFDPSDLPGFLGEPNYLRTGGFAEVDFRQPLNARKGGWYRFDVSRYLDRNTGAFTFNSFEADVRQFASILAERRVFAARALVTTTNAGTGGQIPFYLLPTLGGNDTLRGFRSQRFRGPHRMLMQAEYRWEIWSAFEAALFVDAGKVAIRRADLNFKDLERDYGIGFRFNTDNGVVFRVDAAFGSRDGKHLHIVAGGIF